MSRSAERAKQSRAALDRAADDRCVVRIVRSIRSADVIEGCVVGQGIRWVLVHRLSRDLDLDGYTAVRRKHIKRIDLLGRDHVGTRALTQRGVVATPADGLDPTTTGLLLHSAAEAFGVVVVHPESKDPSICWVGPITGFGSKTVQIAPIDSHGHRSGSSIELPFNVITRVDLGTRYQVGLAHAAEAATKRLTVVA